MKIKDGCKLSTNEFWYDLTVGGYLKPDEILENPEDIKRVTNAIEILIEFEVSCEEQINGFLL